LAREQVKLPVRVTFGANTPAFPRVVAWVPLMLQVLPTFAHFVHPDGASLAACAVVSKSIAARLPINL